jgi:hypothetical protein
VIGLLAALLLQMSFLAVFNVKCLYILSEMLHFYDLETPAIFGFLLGILQDTAIGLENL